MSPKEKYRELCRYETTIPIFSRAWWLDAVCGDSWDVCVVERGGDIVASMPYSLFKRSRFVLLRQPALTQTLGPWIRRIENIKESKRLSREKELMGEIIDQLPKFSFFQQNWHYSLTNWLPFYWKGFKQTTRYTYVIPDISSPDQVISNFDHSKKKNIKRASRLVEVVFDIPIEEFYENHATTLAKQGKRISYSKGYLKSIFEASSLKESGRTIAAYDQEKNLHAALFVIWDEVSAYDLISTIDPDFRSSGAASLLVSEMIRYLSNKTERFDFEGSMIEAVEQSFRRFGATQTPYFSISKTPSLILQGRTALRGLLSKMRL